MHAHFFRNNQNKFSEINKKMEWNGDDNLEETLEDMIRQLIRMEKKFNSCENNKLERIIL